MAPALEQHLALGPAGADPLASQRWVAEYVGRAMKNVVAQAFPVGAIYTNVTGTNPGTELGYGTWTAFAAGRVLAGFKAATPPFDVVEANIGSATHTHEYQDVIEHEHTLTLVNSLHQHGAPVFNGAGDPGGGSFQGSDEPANDSIDVDLGATSVSGGADPEGVLTGETLAASSLPEAVVVHFWKRTA